METTVEEALLDKALAQDKYLIASNMLHDIGNAVVGLSSYVTRIKRLLEQDNSDNLQNLAGFLKSQNDSIASAIGPTKADAIVKLVSGIGQTQKANQQDISNANLELQKIITHIQDILNIQRQYIAGPGTPDKRQIALKGLINDCIAMLLASFKKRGIHISIDIPDVLPLFVGDRTKLMQVILNVLKNSIEAIDVYASDKSVSLNASANCTSLTLKIRDSGRGFDEETGNRLFTRGFTTKKTGTGLGLGHCRAILEEHTATIDITSEGPGRGALTTIEFKILEN
jgi:signal transduction histidine kinase